MVCEYKSFVKRFIERSNTITRILCPEARPRKIPGSNIELSKGKLVKLKWVPESRRFLILNPSLEPYLGPIWRVSAIIGIVFLVRRRATSSRANVFATP